MQSILSDPFLLESVRMIFDFHKLALIDLLNKILVIVIFVRVAITF